MEPLREPANTGRPFPFTPQDWEQTAPAVQAYLRTVRDALGQLHDRIEALEARLRQNSTTSSQPPSADSPYKKPRRDTTFTTPRKAGGKQGHPGHRQVLLAPTTVQELRPERCACGNTTFALTTPYYTHQVLELPPITIDVTHWVLHQGWCPDCGRWSKALVPAEHASGYGPRFSALMGELTGTYGNGRRMVQTFCASVLQVPISLGALQKVLDRVAHAIALHYDAIAHQARQAPVNYTDETPWLLTNTLQWLWVMASDTVAFYMIHPHRSKEAFVALIDDWAGILVSDGYGVYQHWVPARQTCVAHLIRTARSLAERQNAELAACGAWALAELQRLCHMATELSGKRLELLREAVPSLARVAVLWNARDAAMTQTFKGIQEAAPALGVGVQPLGIQEAKDIDRALATMTAERPDALFMIVDMLTRRHTQQVVDFAAQRQLPTLFESRDSVAEGGLMSYGPSFPDLLRRATTYVDKILKGVKPADLPVEQPMKFELVLNLKTAKALGLTIPPSSCSRRTRSSGEPQYLASQLQWEHGRLLSLQ